MIIFTACHLVICVTLNQNPKQCRRHKSLWRITETAAASLSTSDYLWLLPEGWEKVHLAFLVQNPLLGGLNIFRPQPPAALLRPSAPRTASTEWILTTPNHTPVGIAQVQDYSQSFATFYLNFKIVHLDAAPWWPAALALLVGSIFILRKADVIFVLSPVAEQLSTLHELAWGIRHEIWSPFSRQNHMSKPGDFLPLVEMSQQGWREHPMGSRAFSQLNYLSQRQGRIERLSSFSPKKKPGQSLVAFLQRIADRF